MNCAVASTLTFSGICRGAELMGAAQRGSAKFGTPDRPMHVIEHERDWRRLIVPVATIFLTNKECRFAV